MTALIPQEILNRWQDPSGRFAPIIAPVLNTKSLRLVRVDMLGDKTPRLEILLEPQDSEALTLDRCAEASKLISATLDVADPIADKYTLDVGSAGGERPLTSAEDFDRFAGFTVKIKLSSKMDDGRGKLKGSLAKLDNAGIHLADGTVLPPDTVQEIRLVADEYYFDRVKQGTFPKPTGALK